VSHRNAPLSPTGRHSQRHPLDLRSPVSRVPDISFLTDTPIRSEPGRRAGPPRVPSRHLRNPSCRSRSMASHHRQSSLTRHRCSADVEPAKRPPRRNPGPRPLPRATLVGWARSPAGLLGPVGLELARAVEQLPGPHGMPGGARYELKWDGYRMASIRTGDGYRMVRLWSRQGPHLALPRCPGRAAGPAHHRLCPGRRDRRVDRREARLRPATAAPGDVTGESAETGCRSACLIRRSTYWPSTESTCVASAGRPDAGGWSC
jgi:hypothetical protein